jgi:acetate kinase
VRVLVVNAGSSSLKLSLLDGEDQTIAEQELAASRAEVDPEELREALSSPLSEADAVGHRIVHGGERYREAVRIDEAVEVDLRGLADLAPLHQSKSLRALDAVGELLGDLPAVACFDTAFHATLPPASSTYALPQAWRERWGLRRFGFHGLSHGWVARRVPELLGRAPQGLRIVSCHLGAGASLCAIADGRSIDTTMGFTPVEGLVMATRSGSVDPGMLLWLLQRKELSADELADALEHESGLLALSGSADMREVLRRNEDGDKRARLAIEVFVHSLRAGIAAMAASLGGLDVLAFTGGVGEHAERLRALTLEGLGFLGLKLDEHANANASGDDAVISASGGAAQAMVLPSREDIEIARQTRAVLETLKS